MCAFINLSLLVDVCFYCAVMCVRLHMCARARVQCVYAPGCVGCAGILVVTSIFNHLFNSHELYLRRS